MRANERKPINHTMAPQPLFFKVQVEHCPQEEPSDPHIAMESYEKCFFIFLEYQKGRREKGHGMKWGC